MSCSPSLYKRQRFILFLQKWLFVLTLGQVLPKQLIAVIVKIADHLQRKHVASEVNATLLKPPKESTPRAGRRITVGCIMTRIVKVPFARFARSLGRLVMFSVVGVWVTKPFKNWKKAVKKLKAHARSDSHSHATATLLAAKRAAKDGTVV